MSPQRYVDRNKAKRGLDLPGNLRSRSINWPRVTLRDELRGPAAVVFSCGAEHSCKTRLQSPAVDWTAGFTHLQQLAEQGVFLIDSEPELTFFISILFKLTDLPV